MSLQIDSEVLAELAPLSVARAESEPPPVGDVATRRANTQRISAALMAARPAVAGVEIQRYPLHTDDGATLTLN